MIPEKPETFYEAGKCPIHDVDLTYKDLYYGGYKYFCEKCEEEYEKKYQKYIDEECFYVARSEYFTQEGYVENGKIKKMPHDMTIHSFPFKYKIKKGNFIKFNFKNGVPSISKKPTEYLSL